MSLNFDAAAQAATGPIPTFRQGQMVRYFIDPAFAVPPEPCGRMTGIILTDDGAANGKVHNLFVAPMVEANGRRALRPDLGRQINITDMTAATARDGRPLIQPPSVTQAVLESLYCMIRPHAPMPGAVFDHGEFAWFDHVPFSQDYSQTSAAPILCLTPPAHSRQTGMVLILRGFTNWQNMNPRLNTAIIARAMKPSYVKTDLMGISLQRGKQRQGGMASLAAMQEVFEKLEGQFDQTAYQRNKLKYLGEKGELPESVRRALADQERQHNRGGLAPQFR